jgi:hypothetical protein
MMLNSDCSIMIYAYFYGSTLWPVQMLPNMEREKYSINNDGYLKVMKNYSTIDLVVEPSAFAR